MPDFTTLRAALPPVLRAWHRMNFPIDAWDDAVYLTESLHSDAAVTPTELRREHVCAMIDTALHALAARNPEAERLLRMRYLRRRQRGEVASQQPGKRGAIPLSQVKYAQAQALDALAHEVALLEEQARQVRMHRIDGRANLESLPDLVGRAERQQEALQALIDPQAHWVVAIEGLGGIGKTTLAAAVVRALAPLPHFADIFWISARQTYFSAAGEIRADADRPAALTYDQLLAELAEGLALAGDAGERRPADLVRAQLKARPYLVAIDNLETVQDCEALLPELFRLAGPSKFLLTSRESVHGAPEVYSIRLEELAEPELFRLVRRAAAAQGVPELAQAPDEILHAIYAVTGGNPLAARLVVGQAYATDLDTLLAEMREARSRSADELFRFVYWRSWHALSAPARRVLLALPLAGAAGARLEQLAGATKLEQSAALAAITELVRQALVEVGGSVQTRRYRIHRLTETFLMHEVLKWSPDLPTDR